MTDHSERRRALRVDANLNLEVKIPLADGSSELATHETINISTSGIYFKSDHFIEPMTKLAMELEVKVPGAAGSSEPGLSEPFDELVNEKGALPHGLVTEGAEPLGHMAELVNKFLFVICFQHLHMAAKGENEFF